MSPLYVAAAGGAIERAGAHEQQVGKAVEVKPWGGADGRYGTNPCCIGVPLKGRTLLLNSDYYGALSEDTVISNLGANQQPEIITGNRLPMVHGFEVIEARAEAHRAHAHATTPGYVRAAKVPHVHAALGRDAQRL